MDSDEWANGKAEKGEPMPDTKTHAEPDKTKNINTKKEKIKVREWVEITQQEKDALFERHGEKLANEMLDILDANNTKRQEHYKSDYGALKIGGWVYQAALKNNALKKPANASNVDRRTRNMDGTPVTSPHDGRF